MTHNSTPANELADRLARLIDESHSHSGYDYGLAKLVRYNARTILSALRSQPPSDAIRNAVIEECAKVAETLNIGGGTLSSWINTNESPMEATKRHIAIAIRALAQDNHIKGQDNG